MILIDFINPINWYYWTIGNLRKLLYKSQQENIVKVANRAANCPQCWKAGECIHCGCSSYEMFLSNKPCSMKINFLTLKEILEKHTYLLTEKEIKHLKNIIKNEN